MEKYHHENDEYLKKEALIKSAIALNFYFDLSGQDLSDDEYKKALAEQFVGIKHWFKKEIILFANIQLLLNSEEVYKLSRSLISEVHNQDLVSVVTSNTLLNAVFVLVKDKQPDKAKVILNTTSKLNYSKNDLLTNVRIKFMNALLAYIDTHKKYVISQFLDSLEDKNLKESYTFAFLQIKYIYNFGNN